MSTTEPSPTMVDQLADDAKTPPEYPPGAPKLYPLLKMPYRRRAVAMRKYGELQDHLKAHPELAKPAGGDAEVAGDAEEPEVDLNAAADSYEMVAVMDEVLEAVARDENEYENWADRFDVDVFMATWAAWQAEAQPGEASSSSS
ncbi:MAG TPA: hypothetical protein VIQ30_24255 [Pseudonocardia sp.]